MPFAIVNWEIDEFSVILGYCRAFILNYAASFYLPVIPVLASKNILPGHNPRRLPPILLSTIELLPLLGYPWTGGRSGMDFKNLVRAHLKVSNLFIVCRCAGNTFHRVGPVIAKDSSKSDWLDWRAARLSGGSTA